ncbi:MAG: twin-arginine translocation signal domain-containing protein, partial [Planctomycetota bacterium]
MSKNSRRSFLTGAAAAAASGSSMLRFAQATEGIPGFDQTETDYDAAQVREPFSDRKVRVGIVGHGVCQFGLQFGLQHHPNVELVAVSDLFPDRCADMARKAKCDKTYP